MKRAIVIAAILSLLVLGAAVAQQARPRAGRMGMGRGMGQMGPMPSPEGQPHVMGRMPGMGMPGGTPMMGMAGTGMGARRGAELASWDGSIYILRGRTLQKLNSDLDVVRTVRLEAGAGMGRMRGRMGESGMMGRGAGMGRMHGQMGEGGMMGRGAGMGRMRGQMGQGTGQMMGRGRGPHMGPPGPPTGAGQAMPGRMQMMMRARMLAGMMGEPAIAADAKGVYVYRGGAITVFDHDLNQIASERLEPIGMGRRSEQPRPPMPVKPLREARPQAPEAGPQAAPCEGEQGPALSDPVTRTIPGGKVTMQHVPADLQTGAVRFRIGVLDAAGDMDDTARVSAYVYPQQNTEAGTTIKLVKTHCAHFVGDVTLAEAGEWELAVRAQRPDQADQIVYYPFAVDAE